MRPPTDEHRELASCRHSHLAAVYLALGDDLQAPPPRRSAPRVVCALAAGVVLALAAPLAWVSPAPRDQLAATAAGKAAGVELDDEDAGGPWPVA
jgi:ferric-dicitrate binding protein FerR (iron transport regulator)